MKTKTHNSILTSVTVLLILTLMTPGLSNILDKERQKESTVTSEVDELRQQVENLQLELSYKWQ